MKTLKSIYTFIAGDSIILIGVLLTIAVVALIEYAPALLLLRPVAGALLIIAVVAVLVATLSREAFGKRE